MPLTLRDKITQRGEARRYIALRSYAARFARLPKRTAQTRSLNAHARVFNSRTHARYNRASANASRLAFPLAANSPARALPRPPRQAARGGNAASGKPAIFAGRPRRPPAGLRLRPRFIPIPPSERASNPFITPLALSIDGNGQGRGYCAKGFLTLSVFLGIKGGRRAKGGELRRSAQNKIRRNQKMLAYFLLICYTCYIKVIRPRNKRGKAESDITRKKEITKP